MLCGVQLGCFHTVRVIFGVSLARALLPVKAQTSGKLGALVLVWGKAIEKLRMRTSSFTLNTSRVIGCIDVDKSKGLRLHH